MNFTERHPRRCDSLLNERSYELNNRINKLQKHNEDFDIFIWNHSGHHEITLSYDEKRDRLYPTMRKSHGDR